LTKAKALRPAVERLVTKARKGADLNNRRNLLKSVNNEKAVNKLLNELGQKYQTRPGGYTRIIRLDARKGDNAKMAVIEFV
jgi:large subunit ribosomal protein L17